jgi:hypothetical protein
MVFHNLTWGSFPGQVVENDTIICHLIMPAKNRLEKAIEIQSKGRF